MKIKFPLLSLVPLLTTAFLLSRLDAFAQVLAQDDAAQYTGLANDPGWFFSPTTNGGFGFNAWVFQQTLRDPPNNNYSGYYINNGDAIGSTNGKSWGMYANGASGANAAVAFRSFSNSMPTNTVFKIKWHNKGIGFSSTHRGGFTLRNGNAHSSPADADAGLRFSFSYVGGSGDSFTIQDFNGAFTNGLPFSASPFQVEFTLLDTETYRLVIKDVNGINTLYELDNELLTGSGTIDSVALYAFQTDADQVFNSMSLSSTSLVPPDIQNITPTNGESYVNAGTAQLSFDVVSLFSGSSSNGIKLAFDGVNQTNLSFTGSGSLNVHAVLNSSLTPNTFYNATITATDTNNNHTTNNFTFNTFLQGDPFIDAEDYNFASGQYYDTFTSPQPNQNYQALFGSNGVDYLEYDLSGANNAYRPTDLPQTETATDVDHNNFVSQTFQDYDLGFIQNGEWENYTRRLSNTVYYVYARMSGFGGTPTMLMERLATATATSSNQPRASLGTFVCPPTGGAQNWTFVALKDFFSRAVLVHFPVTNTFRLTCIGSDGSYNNNYLILVPATNTATLRPYISSGYPYSNAVAAPDGLISFSIANRDTAVTPGSITVYVNGTNVTTSLILSNNTAGTTVSYRPAALLLAGTNNIQASFSDGAVIQTNRWPFTVSTLPVIPTSDAAPLGSGEDTGFAVHIFKITNDAPANLFTSVARAEQELAGLIIDANTSQPYPNEAGGPNGDGRYHETGAINYDITGTPQGAYTFNTKSTFPYLPAVAPGATNNFIALEAFAYLQLATGAYTLAVRSDDGFKQTVGPTVCDTNFVLGVFDGGRNSDNPSAYDFIVQTNGLYPIRLLYFQGEFGGNVEFYSINRTNGAATLINDPGNPNAIKAYPALKTTLGNVVHSGNITTFTFNSEACRNHTVLYQNTLGSGSWQSLSNLTGDGTVKTITDTTANGNIRFYRVTTQ